MIEFSIDSEDPLMFSLTFRTTGGPATHVTWTRDNVKIVISLANSTYTSSQSVRDHKESFVRGDYENILTVSGRLPGVYGVSVTNDQTTIPVVSNVTILGKVNPESMYIQLVTANLD